ncbi:type II toxin-antitoxin system VapC family toxin [Methylocapsa sp. S129]|uniref:type II toxin-antitoxin system VapC family toxin n=1 Tax=Methylocapsa sp. S129 TaxID=1641869 RepID=UPI00131BF845|nr:type II toxin-antitoxin system VapC family toxin [Methylocapsa sp. S129]
MRVVDTSAWIEWTSDTPLGQQLAPQIPNKDQWLVPTVVQYELVRWARRHFGEDAADKLLAYSMGCLVAPLDTRLATRAADCARAHTLAMADAVIYATAIESGADLLTCDAHFAGLPHVVHFAKSAP